MFFMKIHFIWCTFVVLINKICYIIIFEYSQLFLAEWDSGIKALKINYIKNNSYKKIITYIIGFVLKRALFWYIICLYCGSFKKTFDIANVSRCFITFHYCAFLYKFIKSNIKISIALQMSMKYIKSLK